MINIFTVTNELTTYSVCKWLNFFKINQNLILPNYYDYHISIKNGHNYLRNNLHEIKFNGEDVFWYRRGAINFDFENNKPLFKKKFLEEHKLNEIYVLKNLIYNIISKEKNLALIQNSELNRVYSLIVADRFNLIIPQFLVTNFKDELLNFFDEYKKIINKPLGNDIYHVENNKLYSTKIKILSKMDIQKLPAKFFPSLFLQYVDKKYEVRSFFLLGKFYSMAIMSQSNSKTKIDFRNYDRNFPNRYAPYELPNDIRIKLKRVINHFKLKTCSIDLLINKKGEYVFLEINPVGQFTFLNNPCNYYLEKKIAIVVKNMLNHESI